MSGQKESLWHRLRHHYRLSLIDDSNLNELFHFRLNGIGTFSVLFLLFVLSVGLMSLLVIYTPVRNILPGYNESIRQRLIEESVRLDSLEADLALQRQYLSVIQQVTAGTVATDTVQSLDSLQLVMREQLLEAKSQATEDFVAQYESREKDALLMFSPRSSQPIVSFFRPVHGVVEPSSDIKSLQVFIRTTARENVTAVMEGTVIFVAAEMDSHFTVLVQHQGYVSLYRHVHTVLKTVGSHVQAGETIALMNQAGVLGFSLWHDGKAIDPQKVIVF